MEDFEQFLNDIAYEKLELAENLSDVESKNDPEDDPYRSKYKARDIYLEIKGKFKEIQGEVENERSEKNRLLSAVLELKLAINYIDTDETHLGEEALSKCVDELEKHKLDKKACHIYQNALNQLGILSCGRGNHDKAMGYLEEAENLYRQFKHEVGSAPHSLSEYLKAVDDDQENLEQTRNSQFENTYTHTLYYMAQIFAKKGETEKSAQYCQVTLQRQLEYKQYDPVDWALNAATLSQYYLTVNNYNIARHCLASSTRILEEASSTSTREENHPTEPQAESLQQRKADIERCWVKYGLMLMEVSKDQLDKEVEEMDLNKDKEQSESKESTGDHNSEDKGDNVVDEGTESTGGATSNDDTANDEDMKQKMSTRFNLELTTLEESITDRYLLDFTDAREVFLWVQKWLNSAKEFYTFNDHCSDHIEIIQDHSRAYKLLAFFELNLDRQCKMHKRRVDMLMATLSELNPQYYLLCCHQLMYEIAETYSSMLDLKLAIMETEGGTPTPHAAKKINQLTQQSITQYDAYLTSLKGGKPEFPDKFSDMDLRPTLVAKFCMGRLYSKFLTGDIDERLENISKSVECYKFLVDYCERHPDSAEAVKSELSICKEMVQLLPLKMERIRMSAES